MSHEHLPLPDFDHLPVGSLAGRIRALGAEQLEELLAYEQEHSRRLHVVQVLQARLDEVRSGAPLSSGSPEAARPESDTATQGQQAASPDTAGPPVNPPSHGVPTNRAQPRR
jgi:hypothetical protein